MSVPASTQAASVPPHFPFPVAQTFHFDEVEGNRLKTLGNELFQQKKYVEALEKYTEGARSNPTNPLLYANRAAVHLAMKNHIDAVFDSERATSIDPSYAKAWGRLGTALYALSSWDECSNAWQKALECLSKPTLTTAELALRRQVEEGLKLAAEGSAKNAATAELAPHHRLERFTATLGSTTISPWDRAEALKETKRQAILANRLERETDVETPTLPSCVFSLTGAAECFREAVKLLGIATLGSGALTTGDGPVMGMMAGESILENLTNGILVDERAFCVANPHRFYGVLSRQYILESICRRGFVEGGGLPNIKKEILRRLGEEGWESVRPAISTTIRYWIFQAHWRFYVYGPTFFSYHLYSRVIKFIQWGRSQWPNSPVSECGSCFTKEFVRGVMRLRLQLMQMIFDSKYAHEVEHAFTIHDIIAAGEEVLGATAEHAMPAVTENPLPLGYFLALWVSPARQAHETLGFAYTCLAKGEWITHGAGGRAYIGFERAIEHYKEATLCCAQDDANYTLLLRKQLECMCFSYRPLQETLAICSQIEERTQEAWEIWPSPHDLGKAILNNCAQVKQFREWCEKEVKEGRMAMEETDQLILPAPYVYPDISQVEDPFKPFLWQRDLEGGTDRMIPVDPVPPPNHCDEPKPSPPKN